QVNRRQGKRHGSASVPGHHISQSLYVRFVSELTLALGVIPARRASGKRDISRPCTHHIAFLRFPAIRDGGRAFRGRIHSLAGSWSMPRLKVEASDELAWSKRPETSILSLFFLYVKRKRYILSVRYSRYPHIRH